MSEFDGERPPLMWTPAASIALVFGGLHVAAAAVQSLVVAVVGWFMWSDGAALGGLELVTMLVCLAVPLVGSLGIGVAQVLAALNRARGGATGVLLGILTLSVVFDLTNGAMALLGAGCLLVPFYGFAVIAEGIGVALLLSEGGGDRPTEAWD